MFFNSVDIANRACQHIGVPRIANFSEDSRQAAELSFAYDKVRRAELRRNVWRFAIKRTAIRPVGTGTVLISPPLWSSTTTYGFGALVTMSGGSIWQSLTQDNLNNQPDAATTWDKYCGPMTASPFDTTGTTGYFAGEIVYETPGDGTYTTYLSLQSGNSQDPRAPSQWAAATQYSKDQPVLYYSAYAAGTNYAAGQVARYLTIDYISLSNTNTGNTPPTSPTKWAIVPTALAPAYYDSTVAYTAGQFVTYLGTNYVCILASTGNAPSNTTYWAAQAAGTTYVSLIDFNLNNDPSTASATPWNNLTNYNAGDLAGSSTGLIYRAVTSNTGADPTTDNGTNWFNTGILNPWTTTNLFGNANTLWLQLAVALIDLNIAYPIGAGPSQQSETRNVFRLPAGFLRKAPQDPKAGSVSFMGAPTGLMYEDWNLEGNYLVSRESYPIALRFIADISDVRQFDDMFCEGLAARLALETCEPISQSDEKKMIIQKAYDQIMGEARTVNGIETGPTEPPVDDWISCRV